ncbi:hypothetical protein [Sphingobium sp.]|uniref:hypothetical protein n=1 Tax=Sphingobium sp. TaxID=1912891 RepID=UPI00257A22EE|nr:hypothetical protein [Sphingobium sp.]
MTDDRAVVSTCRPSRGGMWIVYPERLRGAPHICALVDHLADLIADWQQAETMP